MAIGVQKGSKRGSYKTKKQRVKEASKISNSVLPEDGMTYYEIAEILGLTESQVISIEKNALRKLQVPTEKNKRLKKYMEA